jgi:hypothetical protein
MDLLPPGNPYEQPWIDMVYYFCTWQFSHSVYLKTNSDYVLGHFYITAGNTRNILMLRKKLLSRLPLGVNVLFLF